MTFSQTMFRTYFCAASRAVTHSLARQWCHIPQTCPVWRVSYESRLIIHLCVAHSTQLTSSLPEGPEIAHAYLHLRRFLLERCIRCARTFCWLTCSHPHCATVAGLASDLNLTSEPAQLVPILESCHRAVRFLPMVRQALAESRPNLTCVDLVLARP